MKRLIINADDFGFTQDVNAGIIHAHCHGVLTSTTLMANGNAFEDAVRLSGENPSLDVGCHLVLVQGRSIVTGSPLPATLREVVQALALRRIDPYAEFKAQIERIVAAGVKPTHLDTHKHTHFLPGVFRAVIRLATEFAIPNVRLPLESSLPVRKLRPFYEKLARGSRVRMTDHFLGFRLTGALTERSFGAALRRIADGTTEFMCHPGYLQSELSFAVTRLKESRVRELEALTSPEIRRILDEESIHLATFGKGPIPTL